MASILHRVVIKDRPESVYKSLIEREGLSGWWTGDCAIGTQVGDISKFRFAGGTIGPDMKIEELVPNETVKWQCVGGIDEWIGTEIEFTVKPHEKGSVLFFSHRGWPEESEFYMHCNCKWAFFLGVSLKDFVETGEGRPHPYDPDF